MAGVTGIFQCLTRRAAVVVMVAAVVVVVMATM
jgi:hypothetical protein